MYDVFCYGAVSLDISGRLECTGCEQTSATDYRMSVGGDAALVALTLSGMGLKVAIGGSPIGADPMGEYILKTLAEAGITSLLQASGKTAITAVALGDRGRRTTITYHENTPEIEIPVQEDVIEQSKYLYVCGCFERNSAIAGKIARSCGIPSLLNLGEPSMQSISQFGTVIASEEISRMLSAYPVNAARKIHNMNKGIGIVTLGEKGCVCDNGKLLKVPAFEVDTVDTTGAGAAFAAGYIYADLLGVSLHERLTIASAAGALKVMSRGSYRKVTKADILELIERRLRR